MCVCVCVCVCVYVCVGRERQKDRKTHTHTQIETDRQTEVYFKELASPKSTGWTDKLEIKGRANDAVQVQRLSSWRPREEPMLPFKSKGHLLQNCLLLGGGQSFVLFRPSLDWMRTTHIIEDNLLYSKFTDFEVILIQKHPHRIIHNNG